MLNVALATIQDEHRSLAAVVHGLKFVVREIREGKVHPDFRLLWAMLYYIDAFPEKLHHPKEDSYLFAKLRRRTNEGDQILAELEKQHREGAAYVREMELTLGHFEAGKPGGFESFAGAVETFAETIWNHMNIEERTVIPLAKRVLTDEDWVEIGEAFGANGDPRFGLNPDHEFRDLFSRIVNLAPSPIGLGPADTGKAIPQGDA